MTVNDSGAGARMAFGVRPAAPVIPAEDTTSPPDSPLQNGEVVDLAAERRRSGVDEVLRALDEELVGLAPVKARIRQIAALLLVDSARARFGLTTNRPNLHMCFTGDPGTGKTTVALRMADLLKRLGYLERGHLVAVGREDLVGQYVGHTAPKTKEVLKRAMGGVLFIDEAYYLYRAENERDYGQESIEILLQVMENQRQDLVVILAGYKERMDTFFQANPGMSSRIAHHIDFPGYTLPELEQIGMLMITRAGYQLSPDASATFREYLARRRQQPRFANARSVRNAIERARLRHASRLFDSHATRVSMDDLIRLEPEDFLASRVFTQPLEDVVHHA
jgi:probable Rubsico expression protein CbbX